MALGTESARLHYLGPLTEGSGSGVPWKNISKKEVALEGVLGHGKSTTKENQVCFSYFFALMWVRNDVTTENNNFVTVALY